MEFQVGNEVLFPHKQEGPAPLLSRSFGVEMFEATLTLPLCVETLLSLEAFRVLLVSPGPDNFPGR